MINYRFLDPCHLTDIHATLVAAFADYAIKTHPTREQMEHLLIRRGIDYALSAGAFVNDRMIGVMATGFGPYNGQTTSYDIFTGVVREERNRGIAGTMIEFVRPRLVERGANQFVLEVLQENAPALKAYRRVGMQATRELQCFTLDPAKFRSSDTGHVTIAPAAAQWKAFSEFWNWTPSWQNSPEAIERSVDQPVCLTAEVEGQCAGYIVFEPATRDLCQLAVAPDHRRLGVATRLLASALEHIEDGPLRILNIDTRATADLAFFTARGAEASVRQFEMVLELE